MSLMAATKAILPLRLLLALSFNRFAKAKHHSESEERPPRTLYIHLFFTRLKPPLVGIMAPSNPVKKNGQFPRNLAANPNGSAPA